MTDRLAFRVAARAKTAELLTKQWLMGVRRGWLHLLAAKPKGWPAIFKAFDAVRDFVDNLEEQVKYERRGPSVPSMKDGQKIQAAFAKLKTAIAEKRRAAEHWMRVDEDPVGYGRDSFTKEQGEHMRQLYEEKFGDVLTTYVKSQVNPEKGRWNDTREAPITELLDKVLELLRADAARLQEAIKAEKDITEGESPTEDVFKDPAFKEFSFGHMKVIVTDPKGNGHKIRSYVRILDAAYQLIEKKGFSKLWYGTLFLQSSSDFKLLSDEDKRMYERAGYHDIESTAGEFHSGADVVVITAPADDRTIKIIVHELGHRYWFKFMNSAQRARFADLLRVQQPPLMSNLISADTIESARRAIVNIGNERKKLLVHFNDAFRIAPDNAAVEKLIAEYAPKFKAMVGTDPLYAVMMQVFSPMSDAWGIPERKKLYESTKAMADRYTGTEESAEVKFRRHMLPDELLKAWKDGMSEGVKMWVQDAFKLYLKMENVALDYLNHLQAISKRGLDPDESKVMPVSDYGQTNPEEAFAEVFAHYVTNRDMTRDQLESFRSVLSSLGGASLFEALLQLL